MLRRSASRFCRLCLLVACSGFAYGGVWLGLHYLALAVPLLALTAWRRVRRSGAAWSHGTARFADAGDAARGGLLCEQGLVLGRAAFADRPSLLAAAMGLLHPMRRSDLACRLFLAACLGQRWLGGRLLRVSRYVHLATFAPVGAGKSVSVIVPNLLSYPDSVVVIDPKPELYRMTAAHRKQKFGNRIVLLDPFQVNRRDGEKSPVTHRFNPLDGIRTEDVDFLDQCRDLASAIVQRTGKESDPHWNDSAQLVICGFIAFVCACANAKEDRNLLSVRKLLASRESFAETVKRMQAEHRFEGVVSRLGNLLSCFADRELGSVLTTVHRHMEFCDSPAVAQHLAATDFDVSLFRKGKMTAYLTLPPERLVSLAGLQRLWVASLLRQQTKGNVGEKNPVLWLLDEVGHLGKMQALEDAVTLLRGKGIRLWFFFQSIEQVTKCYGDSAKIVLDNIGTQQFFGTSSYETADYISKRIGETTIGVRSRNQTQSRSKSYGGSSGDSPVNLSTSGSITDSDTGRRLVMASEVLTWPEDSQLVFTRNLPVVSCKLLRYYDAPEFAKGRTGTRQGLSVAACLMSVVLMLGGGVFAAFGRGAAESQQLAGFDLPDWEKARQTAKAYFSRPAGSAKPPAAPPLSEFDIEIRLKEAIMAIDRDADIKRNASYKLGRTGAPIPRHLTLEAIESARIGATLAAQLEAEQQRQAWEQQQPKGAVLVKPAGTSGR